MNPEDYYVPKFSPNAPRSPKTNTGPLLFSSSVEISANTTKIANTAALGSPFRKPIFIDEVRWQIRMPLPTQSPGGLNFGGVIQTKLTMGRVIVTNGFVPIWNLGTAMQSVNLVEEQLDTAFGADVSWSHYRWLLPKPLFVPAGSSLVSEFFRIADSIPGDATVHVSYVGRYAPEGIELPTHIDVPFVAVFLPPPAQVNSQSAELDLVNPFLVPLRSQRFIGRILDLTPTTASEVFSSEGPTGNIQVVMKDSYGNNVIRNFTPLSNAFDLTRRAWTFGRILLPKERYNITIQGNIEAHNISISMIGWRREQFR